MKRHYKYYLTLVLLVFILKQVEATDGLKMMKIYGKVVDADLETGIEKSSNECVTDCYQNEDCILVFMNFDGKCLSFGFNSSDKLTVSETTNEEEFYVAFKTKYSLSECPDDYNKIELTVGDNPIFWKKTDDGWTLEKCIADWKMFKRNDGVTVCMQTFATEHMPERNVAKEKCAEMGGYKLTGVSSYEEFLWILQRGTEAGSFSGFVGYWVDGMRNSSYSGKKNDLHFEFTDGYTKLNETLYATYGMFSGSGYRSEDCLMVCHPEKDIYLNDDDCTQSASGFGYVCEYQLC